MKVMLRMTDGQYQALRDPTNANSAWGLCGQCCQQDAHHFMVHRFVPGDGKQNAEKAIATAQSKGMALLFASRADGQISEDHGSLVEKAGLVMLRVVLDDHGVMTGSLVGPGVDRCPINRFSIVGDYLRYQGNVHEAGDLPGFTERHAQCLGDATARLLRQLAVGVVGVSGTGSIVVEQLARLGVGRMVLIEPESIATRNLNRILNSGTQVVGRPKVEVAADAIRRMGFGTEVTTLPANLVTRDAVQAISACDAVFGCVDSAEGRHVLNRIATFYTIPYFDVGLHLHADGKGGIDTIYGSVHYLRPGGSSMLSRKAITEEQIRFDARRRQFPDEPLEALEGDYIKGAKVDSPAVISFNMFYASLAVIEFLNRLHRFREGVSPSQDWICVNLTEDQVLQVPMQWVEEPCPCLAKYVGRGDMTPLLDRPELSQRETIR
jgi:hypothetical protein